MVGGCGSLPGVPIPPNQSLLIFQFHNFDVDSISGSYNFITAGASVHLGRALNRHLRCSFKCLEIMQFVRGLSLLPNREHGFHLVELRARLLVAGSYLVGFHVRNLFHLGREHVLDRHKSPQFGGIQIFQSPKDAFSATWSSCLCFFNDNGSKKSLKNDGVSSSETSGRNSFNRRKWTNVLLAINILVYVAHLATHGKLMLWGAKINGLIDRGQLWRLATSSFLHANIGHLLVNCYSLNSVGPTMESISGPKRYLAIYLSSAVTSSAMSYFLSKSPAVGASGAIFGLVGSVAVFVMRHRSLVGGGKEELQHIANVIVLNMAIGLMSRGIDNWGHLGGLLGGAATAWLLGPEWRFESLAVDGRRVFTDNAPIFRLMNSKSAPRRLG